MDVLFSAGREKNIIIVIIIIAADDGMSRFKWECISELEYVFIRGDKY